MSAPARTIEVLFTPAEFLSLSRKDLSDTVCVVFDVLRATSTIVTALAHGAECVVPVSEIPEALALRREQPSVLLAGERDGLRIRADLTGGIDFDLGNSPREFATDQIRGRTIVLSTTNGSRALRACAAARFVLAGSFLNLLATSQFLRAHATRKLTLVCSGTGDAAAYEDVLGAGALAELVFDTEGWREEDSAAIARQIHDRHRHELLAAMSYSRNGTRLLGMRELRDDVPWCLRRDVYPIVAGLDQGRLVVLPS